MRIARITTKTAAGIIIGLIAATTFRFLAIAAIDAPHNASHNVDCGDCHGEALTGGLTSPFWGGSYSPADIDDTVYNKLCLRCHTASSGPYPDTNAPLVQTHSSLKTSNKYGDWTRECRNCHDPHYQRQKNYKTTDSGNLYLATGTITACIYNGNNTSTLTYSAITYKTGWNATKLTNKTEDYRRTILFPNVNRLGYNYPVVAVDTPNPNTITVSGDATVYLYPPTTFAVLYGQYVKDYLNIGAPGNVYVMDINTGDGADGSITVSSAKNINTDAIAGGRSYADGVNWQITNSVASGQTTISSGLTRPDGFAVGDEIMIINLKGTASNYANVGLYEFKTITALPNSTSITVNSNLNNSYNGTTQKIMVQRVPNYTDMTINSGGSLTSSAFDGNKGGVVVFRANGTVTVNVANGITVSNKGFMGGTGGSGAGTGGQTYNGVGGNGGNGGSGLSGQGGGGGGGGSYWCGGSWCPYSGGAGAIGGGGGGGGKASTAVYCYGSAYASGGGGGSGGYGNVGSGNNPGSGSIGGSGGGGVGAGGGGGSYSVTNPASELFLGSGGGGGGGASITCFDGGSASATGGNGGSGGGIIYISANTVTINSGNTVSSSGINGTNGTTGGSGGIQANGGGGGSGAGGSIAIYANQINNSGNISANGGSGAGGGRTYATYYSFIGNNPTPNYSGARMVPSDYVPPTVQVKFFDKTNTNSFADGNTTYNGVCEVCHTMTQHFRNDGNAPDQNHSNIGGAAGSECMACHGHIDGFKGTGLSTGGYDCQTCHSDLKGYMNGTTGYHHYMNNTGSSYVFLSQPVNMGGTSDTNRNCLMCHVDHNIIRTDINPNGTNAKNLRASISVIPSAGDTGTYSNTDFNNAQAEGGICISCHAAEQTKSYTQSDNSMKTLVIEKAKFGESAHNYAIASTFGADSSTFSANCSKCHNDNLNPKSSFNAQSSANKFGNHQSTLRSVFATLGISSPTEPREEDFCYRCHSKTTDTNPGGGSAKTTAGKDYYGTGNMPNSGSEDIFTAIQKAKAFSTNNLYLRDITPTEPVPHGSGSTDTFLNPSTTITKRSLLPVQGSGSAACEASVMDNSSSAGYLQIRSFVSPTVYKAVNIPAGTWTLRLWGYQHFFNCTLGSHSGSVRVTIYTWTAANAKGTVILAPATLGGMAGTPTAQTFNISGGAASLNTGDRIVLELEVQISDCGFWGCSDSCQNYYDYYYDGAGATNDSKVTLPVGITFASQPSGYGHDVSASRGIHKPVPADETLSYISSNKHVECNDCHHPHNAKAGLHSSNQVHVAARTNLVSDSGPLTGAQGVEPAWSLSNWGGATSWPSTTSTATKEYQICFKCHASANINYADWGGTSSGSWTDVALEFNPANASYHPVVAPLPPSKRLPPAFTSVVIGDSGSADSSGPTGLTDSNKVWATNQWANWGLRLGGSDAVRRIISNSLTHLSLDDASQYGGSYSIEYYAGRGNKSGTTVTDTYKNFNLYLPSLVGYVVVITTDSGDKIAQGTVTSNTATSFTVNSWTSLIAFGSPPADGTVGYYSSATGQTMTCSDCHSNNTMSSTAALGPHGSAIKWMLKGRNKSWPTTLASYNGTGTCDSEILGSFYPVVAKGQLFNVAYRSLNDGTNNGLFCLNCHSTVSFTKDGAGRTTGADVNHLNVHVVYPHASTWDFECVRCHIMVPHGGKISRLLADGDGNMPARYAFGNDLNKVYNLGFTKKSDPAGYIYSDACFNNCGHGAGGDEQWY